MLAPRSPPPSHGGFNGNNNNNNTKGKKHTRTFLTRVRCLLGILIVTMLSTVVYMFHMAHSSVYFISDDSDHPRSALSAALEQHRKYSIYPQNSKQQFNDKELKRRNEEAAAKAEEERKLAMAKHEQWQQQQQVDKHFSKYTKQPKKQGEQQDFQSMQREQPQQKAKKISQHDEATEHKLLREGKLNDQDVPAKAVQESNKKKKDVQQDQATKHKPPQQGDHREEVSNPANKNIFSDRKKSNADGADEHPQQQPIMEERTLRQQERDMARQAALKEFEHGLPVLDNPNRGGSGAIVAGNNNADDSGRAVQAALALEDAKGQEGAKSEYQSMEGRDIEGPRFRPQEERMHELYKQAVVALRYPQTREEMDPLFLISADTPIEQIQRVPFEPQVSYLGVLVDAGRHYFPIRWWKHLIVYLYRLRFNLIHFRLTDDQTFNIQLESVPNLATPVMLDYNKDKKTYTAEEIRELVKFAKLYNISMVPEINVPGHAGGFAGIPGLVIMCPEFICYAGYGLPLNIEHPELKTILKGILKEVLGIFDNPPFLHLGGDEVNMADPCFAEVQRRPFNYSTFESDLKGILTDLHYPLDQVVRWERTGQTLSLQRAGYIEHFWESQPGIMAPLSKMPNGSFIPWFSSQGLYFDTNHGDTAMTIYRNARKPTLLQGVPHPKAIIAGTFELGTEFWLQRNVATRLIAVAIGASTEELTQTKFNKFFNKTCLDLGIHENWCNLQGCTATLVHTYKEEHQSIWSQWKSGICERLTIEEMKLTLKTTSSTKKALETAGFNVFWQNFGEEENVVNNVGRNPDLENVKLPPKENHVIPLTGVIFDMVNSISSPTTRIYRLLEKYVAPLGFNVLQLRLVDDFGFAIQLETQPKLGYSAMKSKSRVNNGKKKSIFKIPPASEFRVLAKSAMKDFGIQIIPELSLTTNAGGWVHSGYSANCPHVLCDKGKGVATAIEDPSFLPVIFSVLREIKQIFSTTPFVHLGDDNRKEATEGCFHEGWASFDDPMTGLSHFEEKLAGLTEIIGIPQERILRWSNNENKRYPDRTGNITHYRALPSGQLPKPQLGERFMVTVDLLSGTPWDIYKDTLALVELKPEGILGEIRAIGKTVWKEKNVGLRLVAFSLGVKLNSDKKVDEAQFGKELIDACLASKIAGCDKPNGSEVSVDFEVEQSEYRDRMCQEFTYNAMGRVPRKDVS